MPTRFEIIKPTAIKTASEGVAYYNEMFGTNIKPPLIEVVRGLPQSITKSNPEPAAAVYNARLRTVRLGVPREGWLSKMKVEIIISHEDFHHIRKALGLPDSHSRNREAKIYFEAGAYFYESAFRSRNVKKKRVQHILELLHGEMGSLDAARSVSRLGFENRDVPKVDAESALAALLFADKKFNPEETVKDFSLRYEEIRQRLRPPALFGAMRRLERALRH